MREEEIGLGKKKIDILVSPKLVKNSFIKSSSFSRIRLVLHCNYQKEVLLSLVCRGSLCSRLFRKQVVFKLPEKNIEM